jgi:hypothetical protein
MMGGWKTWAATIVTICTGVVMLGGGVLADPIDVDMIWKGILVIAGAFGIGLGLGHKIEKAGK